MDQIAKKRTESKMAEKGAEGSKKEEEEEGPLPKEDTVDSPSFRANSALFTYVGVSFLFCFPS